MGELCKEQANTSPHGPYRRPEGSVAGFKGLRPPAAGPPRQLACFQEFSFQALGGSLIRGSEGLGSSIIRILLGSEALGSSILYILRVSEALGSSTIIFYVSQSFHVLRIQILEGWRPPSSIHSSLLKFPRGPTAGVSLGGPSNMECFGCPKH